MKKTTRQIVVDGKRYLWRFHPRYARSIFPGRWLVRLALSTPDGREVGPIGETEEALAQFREMYVEGGR